MVGDITRLRLGYVSAFIIEGNSGYILVDTGLYGSLRSIIKQLKALSIEPSMIHLIILTHNHSDHVGSVVKMVELTGAKVLMHGLEYEAMCTGDDGVIGITRMGKLMAAPMHRATMKRTLSVPFELDIEMRDSFDLSGYGVKGWLYHTPGHTKGSISVLLDNGDAIIADSLMAMMPWDKPGKPIVGYDMPRTSKSMQELIQRGAKRFYLSHGKVYDVEQINIALKKL